MATIPKPRKVILADLDGDGRTDLAVMSGGAAAVHWGSGTFDFPAPALVPGLPPQGLDDVVGANMDGDGFPDLVLAYRTGFEVLVIRGATGRVFREPWSAKLPEPANFLAAADLDGDGFPDLVAVGSVAEDLMVIPGGPSGMEEPVGYDIGFLPLGLRIADFDVDGTLDVVAYNQAGPAIVTGTARGPIGFFRRGDADASGQVDITDAVVILGSLFLGTGLLPCWDATDANDDGHVDISDPVSLLSSLFLGAGALPPPEGCGPDPTPDGLSPCRLVCR